MKNNINIIILSSIGLLLIYLVLYNYTQNEYNKDNILINNIIGGLELVKELIEEIKHYINFLRSFH